MDCCCISLAKRCRTHSAQAPMEGEGPRERPEDKGHGGLRFREKQGYCQKPCTNEKQGGVWGEREALVLARVFFVGASPPTPSDVCHCVVRLEVGLPKSSHYNYFLPYAAKRNEDKDYSCQRLISHEADMDDERKEALHIVLRSVVLKPSSSTYFVVFHVRYQFSHMVARPSASQCWARVSLRSGTKQRTTIKSRKGSWTASRRGK